jgi:hypothetical protein
MHFSNKLNILDNNFFYPQYYITINNIINVYHIFSLILLFAYLLLMAEYVMGFNLYNKVNKMFHLQDLLLEDE